MFYVETNKNINKNVLCENKQQMFYVKTNNKNVLCENKQQSGSMPVLPTLDRHTFQNVGLKKKPKKKLISRLKLTWRFHSCLNGDFSAITSRLQACRESFAKV